MASLLYAKMRMASINLLRVIMNGEEAEEEDDLVTRVKEIVAAAVMRAKDHVAAATLLLVRGALVVFFLGIAGALVVVFFVPAVILLSPFYFFAFLLKLWFWQPPWQPRPRPRRILYHNRRLNRGQLPVILEEP